MTVSHYATAAGRRYQRDLMKYIRDDWGFDAEQLVLAGAEDEGDILLRCGQQRTVIEAKREKGFNLASWVDQASAEAAHYATHRNVAISKVAFVVVHKRRGKSIGESYVTTSLDEWLERQA